MSNVVVLRSEGQTMFDVYSRQVHTFGKKMFNEEWFLEAVPGETGMYRIVCMIGKKRLVKTDALTMVDFVLFWDGFRLCCDEMQA